MLFTFGLYQICIYHDDLSGKRSKGKWRCNKKFIYQRHPSGSIYASGTKDLADLSV